MQSLSSARSLRSLTPQTLASLALPERSSVEEGKERRRKEGEKIGGLGGFSSKERMKDER